MLQCFLPFYTQSRKLLESFVEMDRPIPLLYPILYKNAQIVDNVSLPIFSSDCAMEVRSSSRAASKTAIGKSKFLNMAFKTQFMLNPERWWYHPQTADVAISTTHNKKKFHIADYHGTIMPNHAQILGSVSSACLVHVLANRFAVEDFLQLQSSLRMALKSFFSYAMLSLSMNPLAIQTRLQLVNTEVFTLRKFKEGHSIRNYFDRFSSRS